MPSRAATTRCMASSARSQSAAVASGPAEQAGQEGAGPSRRQLFAAAFAAALITAAPQQAMAGCASNTLSEQDDTECRRKALINDTGLGGPVKEDYGGKSAEKKFAAAPNVPVGTLDGEYARATSKLREDIIQYAKSDPQDPKSRVPLIKTLKQEGSEWVSKYARGGSARNQSARTMYIAVDAVIGHLASNGYAPMPGPKIRVALANCDKAMAFLAENK